jgi:hypothetical protein
VDNFYVFFEEIAFFCREIDPSVYTKPKWFSDFIFIVSVASIFRWSVIKQKAVSALATFLDVFWLKPRYFAQFKPSI